MTDEGGPSGQWYPPPVSGGWGAPVPPPKRSFKAIWLTVAAIAIVLLVVALVNVTRKSSGTAAGGGLLPTPAPTAGASSPSTQQSPPGGSGSGGGSAGGSLPGDVVTCPQIRDAESHLTYRCIDNYLISDGVDNYLGLRISLNHEVEPNWVISEGSGNPKSLASPPPPNTVDFQAAPSPGASAIPSLDAVTAEVQRRAGLALAQAYGDNPSAVVLEQRQRTFSGVTGFELLTEVTMNPAYRAARNLKAKTERLWVVGVPTSAGVSIFMMSIPDERKDLWPKAEATVGTIQVI